MEGVLLPSFPKFGQIPQCFVLKSVRNGNVTTPPVKNHLYPITESGLALGAPV